MNSDDNARINAAYIRNWQQHNPKLLALKTDGKTLQYENNVVDISNIYMQDLLINRNLFHNINTVDCKVLFDVIKTHTFATISKEIEMEQKLRSWNKNEYQ